MKKKHSGPKVLIFDIETAPLEVFAWGLHEQNVSLNQVIKDRSVLAWAAKWMHDPKVMYEGTGGQRDVRDDKRIMKGLHALLNEADIVVTQNGRKFDEPIVNGRFLVHGLSKPGPYKHIDTYLLARKLGFISNKLENLSNVLCPELAKSKHNSFPGQSLWTECLKNNKKAWREMESYNKQDVLATEGVYKKLAPYGTGVNFSLYHDGPEQACSCGSTKWHANGHSYQSNGKFRKWKCAKCGFNFVESGASNNLLTKDKRLSLRGVS